MPDRAKRFVQAAIVLLAVFGGVSVLAQEDRAKITLEEARQVAQEATTIYYPNLFLDYLPKQFVPGFYLFEVQSSNSVASPHVATFAVNSMTGDVWDMAGYCKHLTSLALNRLQEGIRKRLKIKAKEYEELRAQKPMCDAR